MVTPRTTPSQLLMDVMEEFGKIEPIEVFVIWTDEAGDLCWRGTSQKLSEKVGMLECVKTYIMDSAKKEDETK